MTFSTSQWGGCFVASLRQEQHIEAPVTMENHVGYISMLKILIGKFEQGPKEQVGAAPAGDLVDWLNGSLDTFCNVKEWFQVVGAVKAVDSKPDPTLWEKMAKQARALAMILRRVLELEDSLRPSNPAALQDSFLQWSWTKKASQLLQESEVLHDAGGLEAAKLEEKLAQARLKLSQATKNMHWADSEISWRADLAKDAGLEDILAQAQADRSLCSLDGAAIENAISNYQQVGRVLQDSDLITFICHIRLFAITSRW